MEAFQATNEVQTACLTFPREELIKHCSSRPVHEAVQSSTTRETRELNRKGWEHISHPHCSHWGGWKYIGCWKMVVFLPVLQSRYGAVKRFCDRTRIGPWQAVFLCSFCCFDIASLQYSAGKLRQIVPRRDTASSLRSGILTRVIKSKKNIPGSLIPQICWITDAFVWQKLSSRGKWKLSILLSPVTSTSQMLEAAGWNLPSSLIRRFERLDCCFRPGPSFKPPDLLSCCF